MAIGAQVDSEKASRGGAVYIYRFDGSSWKREAKLFSPTAAANEEFGQAVDIRDDFLIVGAPFAANPEDISTGAAFFYRRVDSVWTFQDAQFGEGVGEFFGKSVSMVKNIPVNQPTNQNDAPVYTAAVGAPSADWGEPNSRNYGAVYMYELVPHDQSAPPANAGWEAIHKMCYTPKFDDLCATPGFPENGSRLGTSVAFSDGVLFAGMPGCCSSNGGRARSFGQFNFNGVSFNWASTNAPFAAPSTVTNQEFGQALAASDNGWLAVGRFTGGGLP